MVTAVEWITGILGALASLALYITWNDRKLRRVPDRIAKLSKRLTPESVRADAKAYAEGPAKTIKSQLPEKTGRRYVVVGGGGFLGGWIIHQLLERGEDPENIRVLDLNMTPANYIVADAKERGLQYIKTDVTNPASVDEAFAHPWKNADKPITVFHTAANIRFYELDPAFLPRSSKVNVDGVRNVIEASKRAGVDVFVHTSSASIGVHSTRLLLWPWEKEPKRFVQVVSDKSAEPKSHWDHFSNYAVSKLEGENLVKSLDGTLVEGGKKMRTGSIRPGNGIFGPRGDMICGGYLIRKTNPSWVHNSYSSFIYVENCALSHLLYERRLIDLVEGNRKGLPDIGGQFFNVRDPGPTPTYGDAYQTLETLTDGECHFPVFSPTAMFLLAQIMGTYYVNQQRIAMRLPPSLHSIFTKIFPTIKGDLVNLQPSLFYLTSVHLIFDDSRARLSPEKGGLGYEGVWTTFEGLYNTWKEFDSGPYGKVNARSAKAGIPLPDIFKKKKKTAAAAATNVVAEGINLPVTPMEEEVEP
ncbi:hypothetical protein DFP72DRAFT_958506, partial [Ephemerocybe angulata]